ncbi:MAG TPA: hypothetical protein VGO62_19590, partial [Myxococcota bacterium]
SSSSSSSSHAPVVDRVVDCMERALPGHAVRVSIEDRDATRARSPFQQGPRFVVDVRPGTDAHDDGAIIALASGPLFSLVLTFCSARFTFDGTPGHIDASLAAISARVQELGHDELVVVEQQRTDRLLRSTVVRVDRGRVLDVVDSGVLPHAGTVSAARFRSFGGSLRGPLSREQKRAIDKKTGGLMGRVRRAIGERVLGGAVASIDRRLERHLVDDAKGRALDD